MKKLDEYKKEKCFVAVLLLLVLVLIMLLGILISKTLSSVSEEKFIVSASPIPEVTPSYVPEKQEVASDINILNLQKEAISLLNCTEEQLAEEIKEFLNANGFADVVEVVYEKEIVISHADNTVSAGFYLQREDVTYEICCIYNRDNDTRTVVVWES